MPCLDSIVLRNLLWVVRCCHHRPLDDRRLGQRECVTPLPAAVVHELPPISTASVIQNCADVGHGNGSYAPSDSNGAVGKNNIVAVTRAGIGVYNKSTCLLARYTETLESFFGLPPGGFSIESYPRALYDAGSKRFFVTAFSLTNQYFAVSTDETGTRWFPYKIPLTPNYCHTPDTGFTTFERFLNAGYSHTRWLLTGEMRLYIFVESAIVSIDKAASLRGASVTVACFAQSPPITIFLPGFVPPIVIDASPVAQFLSTFVPFARVSPPGPQTNIYRRNLTISPRGVAFDLVEDIARVTIPGWTVDAVPTQPNGKVLSLSGQFRPAITAGDFQSPSIQAGGFIWNVHTIGINGYARIRLYKLDTSASVTTYPEHRPLSRQRERSPPRQRRDGQQR